MMKKWDSVDPALKGSMLNPKANNKVPPQQIKVQLFSVERSLTTHRYFLRNVLSSSRFIHIHPQTLQKMETDNDCDMLGFFFQNFQIPTLATLMIISCFKDYQYAMLVLS